MFLSGLLVTGITQIKKFFKCATINVGLSSDREVYCFPLFCMSLSTCNTAAFKCWFLSDLCLVWSFRCTLWWWTWNVRASCGLLTLTILPVHLHPVRWLSTWGKYGNSSPRVGDILYIEQTGGVFVPISSVCMDLFGYLFGYLLRYPSCWWTIVRLGCVCYTSLWWMCTLDLRLECFLIHSS